MARALKDSGIEWIGEIPSRWEIIPHKYVMHKEKDICEHYNGEPIISLSMQGVHIRDLDAGGKMPTTFDGYQYVEPENMLLCLFDIDVTPRCVGVVHDAGLTSPAYSRFIVHQGYLNRYYDFLLRFIDNEKVFVHLAKNLRSSLTETDFGAIKTIAPPFDEQSRIASFLDRKCAEIDRIVAETEKTIEEYKALKQSIITEAVTKGVRGERPMKDSGIEWIGEIPEEWEVSRFKYLANIKSNLVDPDEYKTYPQVSPENIEKGSGKLLPCMTVGEVGVISDNHLFYRDQILYSKVRPKLNKITIAPFDGLCSADMYPIDALQHKKYLMYSMLSDVLLAQIAMITEDRVKMPKINQEELGNTWFAKPSESEQEEISDYLDAKCTEIDNLISKKHQLLAELESYKKSVIYEYVTGKKEVPV